MEGQRLKIMPIHEIKYPKTKKWFIAYTESIDIFHFGKVDVTQVMGSGQEKMERFGGEVALATRTNIIKGIPNWYEDSVNPKVKP